MLMMLELTLTVTNQDELDALYPRIKALLPEAQVKVTQPAAAAVTQESPTVTQPVQTATQTDTPVPQITMETVRAKLSDLSRSGKNAQVKQLIADLGYSKFTEVPSDRYAELMAAADTL